MSEPDFRGTDVVVIGSGAAGLSAALAVVPRRATVLTPAALGEAGSSVWAQGGIAAAFGADDSAALHAEDTVAAGAGLTDPQMALLLTEGAAEAIRWLQELGARFDRDGSGDLALGREAAHGRRRILHASGDATGAEVMRTLTAAVREAQHVTVASGETALELLRSPGGRRVCGVLSVDADGWRTVHLASAVVLATGGLGGAYLYTTNPLAVRGDGLALAGRAGARLVDLEMVQFHPTALLPPSGEGGVGGRLPLLTEALRGEGAVLVDDSGRRFMPALHPDAELAPRDIVARAIHRERSAGREVYLDARQAVGDAFPARFPTVFTSCVSHGIDPRRQPIPVTPAAHYHMGGVATDDLGRTSLPGLWAVGEAASTGVHGANRLASNSLLEALVMGARVAGDVRRRPAVVPDPRRIEAPVPVAWQSDGGSEAATVVRRLLWQKVGLVRDGAGLTKALAELEERAWQAEHAGAGHALANLLTVGRLVATAALAREESRGGHFREDFPAADPAWRRRLALVLEPSAGAPPAIRVLPGVPAVREGLRRAARRGRVAMAGSAP